MSAAYTYSDAASDSLLQSLVARPFTMSAPDRQTSPLIFSSPHSGRIYPPSFVSASRLSPLNLRRSEDAFVDELFSGAAAIGAPLIAARFPRAFVDANRAPTELDAAMFTGPLELVVDALSPRVMAGLGVIPKLVRDGAEIYRGKIPAAEAQARLALFHRPYHAALAGLVRATRLQFGVAVLLDCHSMPSAAAAPDVILGDRYGCSAAPVVTRMVERAFESQGFRVTRNVPYAGGYTTQLHGNPAGGIHALQIEINRGLYLDEDRIQAAGSFDRVLACISAVLGAINEASASLAGRRPTTLAAE